LRNARASSLDTLEPTLGLTFLDVSLPVPRSRIAVVVSRDSKLVSAGSPGYTGRPSGGRFRVIKRQIGYTKARDKIANLSVRGFHRAARQKEDRAKTRECRYEPLGAR